MTRFSKFVTRFSDSVTTRFREFVTRFREFVTVSGKTCMELYLQCLRVDFVELVKVAENYGVLGEAVLLPSGHHDLFGHLLPCNQEFRDLKICPLNVFFPHTTEDSG